MNSPREDSETRTQPDTRFQSALQALQAGRLPAAERAFRELLRFEPDHVVALNCLGIIAASRQQWGEAIRVYQQAIARQPSFAEAHSNLGNACRALDDWTSAQGCYLRAIEIKPRLAEAHNGLGTCHQRDGDLAAAAESFQQSLACNPRLMEAWNNLGNVHVSQGAAELALPCFERALALSPNAEVYCNLGNALRDLGQFEASVQAYERAIAASAQLSEAWNNLGTVRVQQRAIPAAIRCYQEAVRQCPDRVDFLINLAGTLARNEQIAEAGSAIDRVVSQEPGQALHRLRRQSLCPAVFADAAEMCELRERMFASWNALAAEPWSVDMNMLADTGCEPPFNLQFLDGNLRELKEAYARIFASRLPHFEPPDNPGRPRVGLVVTRGHEGVFLKSIGPILQRLEPQFAPPAPVADWIVFGPNESVSSLRAAIGSTTIAVQGLAERFTSKVDQLRDARCDVLCYFEIGTDATNYFLPMLRLAKVQCTTWGIQATSGMQSVDYYLSSRLVEPDQADDHYSESLLLADTLLTYQFPDGADRFRTQGAALAGLADCGSSAAARTACRGVLGLAPRDHVYACAQHLGKFHTDFDLLLAGILRLDPLGIVMITQDQSGIAAARLQRRFQQAIPDVADRIRFLPHLAARPYYELLVAADVLLDPPHFGGVNSTYDGLIVGRPIITWPSPFHRGRYTYGCYRKIELFDCVATNAADYVARAVRVGTDRDFQEHLTERIVAGREILFADDGAVAEFQRLFAWLLDQARGARRS